MPAGRRCPRCPTIIPAGTRYCPNCQQQYDQQRGTANARGYGAQHQRLRAHWQRRIDSGELVLCADGCGQRITGTHWDLGHTNDRRNYLGPMTTAHNRSDGGRKSHQP